MIDAKIFQASLLYLKPFDVMYRPGSKDHVVTPEIFSTRVRGVELCVASPGLQLLHLIVTDLYFCISEYLSVEVNTAILGQPLWSPVVSTTSPPVSYLYLDVRPPKRPEFCFVHSVLLWKTGRVFIHLRTI